MTLSELAAREKLIVSAVATAKRNCRTSIVNFCIVPSFHGTSFLAHVSRSNGPSHRQSFRSRLWLPQIAKGAQPTVRQVTTIAPYKGRTRYTFGRKSRVCWLLSRRPKPVAGDHDIAEHWNDKARSQAHFIADSAHQERNNRAADDCGTEQSGGLRGFVSHAFSGEAENGWEHYRICKSDCDQRIAC